MIVYLIKGASILFLSALGANLWTASRQKLVTTQDQIYNNSLELIAIAYFMALSIIWWRTYNFQQPLLFVAMISFPLFMSLSHALFKKFDYQGDLRLVLIILGLNVISLVFIYRLQVSSPWKVASLLHYTAPISTAFKQLIYSIVGLMILTVLASYRILPRVISVLESNKFVLPLSGILSFVFLILTKIAGLKYIFTASEIVFKGFFLIFLTSFFCSISSRFTNTVYPARKHIRWIIIFLLAIGVFFGLPLLIYGERGSGYVMLIIFFLLTAHFIKDIRYFLAGIVLLAFLLALACLASPSVRERAFGAWLFYDDYISTPYYPGKNTTPGRQLYTALASIKVTPFGLGLTRGILTFKYDGKVRTVVPEAIHDFISIPLAMELGVTIIAIVCASYILMFRLIPVGDKQTFNSILATCIAATFACQGFYNISGCIGLVVMTGIPAPWLSYSGTAMLTNYTLAAVLLSNLNEKEVRSNET